jgi:hypothetical protein
MSLFTIGESIVFSDLKTSKTISTADLKFTKEMSSASSVVVYKEM